MGCDSVRSTVVAIYCEWCWRVYPRNARRYTASITDLHAYCVDLDEYSTHSYFTAKTWLNMVHTVRREIRQITWTRTYSVIVSSLCVAVRKHGRNKHRLMHILLYKCIPLDVDSVEGSIKHWSKLDVFAEYNML